MWWMGWEWWRPVGHHLVVGSLGRLTSWFVFLGKFDVLDDRLFGGALRFWVIARCAGIGATHSEHLKEFGECFIYVFNLIAGIHNVSIFDLLGH